MNVLNEFENVLWGTGVFKHLTKSLIDEPLKLLIDICNKKMINEGPAPDHSLHMQGYIGDVALKALLESGLIEKLDGGRAALYSYRPTESGMAFYKKITQDQA